MRVFAPAKVNLTLHVTGQREDGFHLLDGLVAFADTGDWLTVTSAGKAALAVTGPEAAGVPAGPENLVMRAVELAGLPAEMVLEKHLPTAAGLGGGSADAAAALRGLAALGGAPVAPEQALTLGADVPMCLVPRPARIGGIGEQITPLALGFDLPALMVNPRIAVPTPAVFRALKEKSGAPMPADLPRWEDPRDMAAWLADQRNDLEAPAIALVPEIGAALDALRAQSGCLMARMSGSGASVFALFATRAEALRAEAAIRAAHPGWWAFATALGDQRQAARPA